ncbi:MAG: ferrochelatase [Cyanobacteria bacterium SZAS LIN-5]|nr:ferrochelatase [Cyanobacteria bacterium SZAS LIN-5]
MTEKYDAILLVSFGGPEGMSDVIPFLENVLRGRNVPPERMQAVAHHYELFGGVSPINQQNRDLIEALKAELSEHKIDLPIYWGNRNWHPMLVDTVKQMQADGIKKALAFVTSAYSSYSGCRQYRENISSALEQLGENRSLKIEKLRGFSNHPGFIEANTDRLKNALQHFGDEHSNVHVAFTAHSVPTSMATTSDYVEQLTETAELIAGNLNLKDWKLCFQSRSGPATQPWLEPDICDHIRDLKNQGVTEMVIAPIGFISDHMEVKYDLDVEAKQLCDELGIKMERAGTAGIHPAFVKMIRQLIEERTTGAERLALGTLGSRPDLCAEDCCPAPQRPPVQTAQRPQQ